MKGYVSLNEIAPGEQAVVTDLGICGPLRRRLLDIGMTDGTIVSCVGRSPCGDPNAFLICGAVHAIRRCDGMKIHVRRI